MGVGRQNIDLCSFGPSPLLLPQVFVFVTDVGVGGGGDVKNKVGGVVELDIQEEDDAIPLSQPPSQFPTPRVFSKSRSCPMKLKFGDTLLFLCFTKSYASFNDHLSFCIK